MINIDSIDVLEFFLENYYHIKSNSYDLKISNFVFGLFLQQSLIIQFLSTNCICGILSKNCIPKII